MIGTPPTIANVPLADAEVAEAANVRRERDAQLGPVIKTSSDFVKGFMPPEFIWDGILQQGFLYSLTAPTGAGKTAIALSIAAKFALRQPICGRDTTGGRAVYLAGENSDDVRMRWLAMAEHLSFDVDGIDVRFIDKTFDLSNRYDYVASQIESFGGAALIVIDTSPAFFQGAEENSNVELIRHAKAQRRFTRCAGRPTVLSLCHPSKNAGDENLVPRGGGGFLAEVDGNLVARTTNQTVELHWQGKLRGPGFEPAFFELKSSTASCLQDSRGRSIWTVVAHDLSRLEAEHRLDSNASLEDRLLEALGRLDNPSISTLAECLGLVGITGEPQKSKVHGMLKKLAKDGLVSTGRRGQYGLTDRGRKEMKKIE